MTDSFSAQLSRRYLDPVRILVVKVGSALLVNPETGAIRHQWLDSLAQDIARLMAQDCRVVVVSSGAIVLGRGQIAGTKTHLKLEEKQAAAAIGQIQLARHWESAFETHNLRAGQILLSPDDTETRRRHLNARRALQTLMDNGIIPVVNENDTVATVEIRYGDNDRLAARVAQMISADALILLSDIDGLYNADPHSDETAEHIPEIEALDEAIMAMAGPAHQAYGSGGMVTKLEAARIATTAGCHMVICNGTHDHPLAQLQDGGRCTWFRAASNPPQARKKWIAGGLKPKGMITIDAGAVIALTAGKSLLAVGITHIAGAFDKGDLIAVIDEGGVEIGRGLSHYNAKDAAKIAGYNSDEIEGILGSIHHEEVIHADNLVLTVPRNIKAMP